MAFHLQKKKQKQKDNTHLKIFYHLVAGECPALRTLVGNATFTNIKGDGIQHASAVKVTCNAYFDLIGPETITCNQGQWQSELPQCHRMY